MEYIRNIIEKQRKFFNENHTKSIEFREKQLELLKEAIKKYEQEIYEALKIDLNKSDIESLMSELYLCIDEIEYAKRHLKRWMRRKYVYTPISQFPSISYKVSEPYGVVAIISPWNYPFLLSIQPLIGAIAAGNCCVLKLSEYAPKVSSIIKKIIECAFQEEYIAVLEGEIEVADALLEQPLDYIFFTGSTQVGKIIMEKAAKHLTPVTLELGGKSPCIIDETVDLSLAAKRIIFGKLLNSGQTCVAPDYIFVQKDLKDKLVEHLIGWIEKMYGSQPLDNENYPKIISKKHYDRLMELMQGEEFVLGGYGKEETLQIAPTILVHVNKQSKVMQEEIFGPILPILTYQSLEEVISHIKEGGKPLALYLFSNDKKVQRKILNSVSFGGGCINDTIMQLTNPKLPFGGVGASGMGQYHGKYSFDTFSHEKSILHKFSLDIPLRYQPFTKSKKWLLKNILKK